jgi:hypothetical protein
LREATAEVIIAELSNPSFFPEVRMRQARTVGLDSAEDLARKVEVLEREMAAQRAAMERLRELGTRTHSSETPRSGHHDHDA